MLYHIQRMPRKGDWVIRWGSREVGRAPTEDQALALIDTFIDRQEADTMRKHHDPDLIVTAWGTWYTHEPGIIEVATADDKHHRITADSYNCSRVPNRLSACTAA